MLANIIKHNPKSVIVVAPETYFFKSKFFHRILAEAKQEIHLFCRETYSYCLLNSMIFQPIHVYLSQDTALYLTMDDLTKLGKSTVRSVLGSYDLLCMRTDKESAKFGSAVTKHLHRYKLLVKDISASIEFEDFISLVQYSRYVYTDRLHVAILGSIFGKEVFLFPNSYYKNKGVFEYSLWRNPKLRFICNPETDLIPQ